MMRHVISAAAERLAKHAESRAKPLTGSMQPSTRSQIIDKATAMVA
jgi:hypothetical protein